MELPTIPLPRKTINMRSCIDCGGQKTSRKGLYCKACGYKHRTRPSGLKYIRHKENPTSFKKGHIPWHTGKKGLLPDPWNKGLKGIHISPTTEFKKGNIAWNKDKKLFPGDKSEYWAIHYWIRKTLGAPEKCSNCNALYQLVWANKSQKYLRREEDWMPLCRSCHMKYDMQFIKTL